MNKFYTINKNNKSEIGRGGVHNPELITTKLEHSKKPSKLSN